MTDEQLNQLINILASITLFEMMVAIGLGVTFADVYGVATDAPLVLRALLASYLCVPAIAIGLLIVYNPDPYVAAGFLIVAVCPGAPFSPPLTGLAKGNAVVAVGLMVILAGSSALAAPLLLRLLLPFVLQFLPPLPPDSPPLAIDAGKVVSTLLLAQFLPLCIGLAVRQWRPTLATRLKKPANVASLILNLATLAAIVYVQFHTLIEIPFRGYLGMLALVMASVAAGWVLGGRGGGTRTAMVMSTSIRNVGLGLVIATGAFAGTRAVSATTAFALFQTLLMALIAVGWGRTAFAEQAKAAMPEPPPPDDESRAP